MADPERGKTISILKAGASSPQFTVPDAEYYHNDINQKHFELSISLSYRVV